MNYNILPPYFKNWHQLKNKLIELMIYDRYLPTLLVAVEPTIHREQRLANRRPPENEYQFSKSYVDEQVAKEMKSVIEMIPENQGLYKIILALYADIEANSSDIKKIEALRDRLIKLGYFKS